jgi:hypothetical protein
MCLIRYGRVVSDAAVSGAWWLLLPPRVAVGHQEVDSVSDEGDYHHDSGRVHHGAEKRPVPNPLTLCETAPGRSSSRQCDQTLPQRLLIGVLVCRAIW